MAWVKRPVGAFTLCFSLSLLLTLILYGGTLNLPLYSDDLVQFPWLQSLTFGQIWTSLSPYDYYRPLVFSLWWVLGAASDEVPIIILRLINIALHATAAALTGVLLLRLDQQQRLMGGIIASLLLASYPFAYQVVPWISGMFYPLMLCLVLLAALAYRSAQQTGGVMPLTIAVVCALLAPLAHENGMLAVGVILGLEGLHWWRQHEVNLTRLLPFSLIVVYIGFWLWLRQAAPSTLSVAPTNLVGNAEILSIGLSYPLGVINQNAAPRTLAWTLLLISAVATLVVSKQQIDVALFGLLWFGLNIGPVLLVMRPDWLLLAPRFLYPASVGAVIVWALAVAEIASDDSHWREVLSVLVVSLIMVPATVYIGRAQHMLSLGGRALAQVSEVEQHNAESDLHFVNLPNIVSPSQPVYPYFSGDAELLPSLVAPQTLTGRSTPRLFAWSNLGEASQRFGYEVIPYGPTLENITAVEGQVYQAYYAEETIELRYSGRTSPTADFETGVSFGESARLAVQDVTLTSDAIVVTVWWEVLDMQPDETVFVHLINADTGELRAQADGSAWQGVLPLHLAMFIEDVRYLERPDGGLYDIYIGVWLPATGERLPTTPSQANNAYLAGSVTVTEISSP